ncbi:MAG: DNA mismatch repair endonuclease MutL [Bacteroidia bacterium]
MADIISLLPENVANQIAAGEVVQRPASVVKELLENAIDAGATQIKLIVKDAGKTLVQVMDNGKGMSETDARMSFERHATSKIKTSEDIFRIATKGFRGEALAAISAVAQVELKTKMKTSDLGTLIEIEANKVVRQEACSCSDGSSFSVKNLFYNVPARRNFLKEDSTELRHIIDEFERVALPHPEISFIFYSNNNEIYNLPATHLIQRIAGLYSNNLKEKLVSVEETTTYLKIKGYVGKPEAAKKRRGEQFFFVNNRFIKSGYLHHAVMSAYEELISPDEFPSYFLFLDLPANMIDINIHPTKTEIKFEDEKTIYAMLRTTVKRSLGKNNLAPSLDFETEQSFEFNYSKDNKILTAPKISFNPEYNPFKTNTKTDSDYTKSLHKNNLQNWQNLYGDYVSKDKEETKPGGLNIESEIEQEKLFDEAPAIHPEKVKSFQLHNKYIVMEAASGLFLVDQQRAHEKILYDHYLQAFSNHAINSQQELFPNTVELSVTDYTLVQELQNDLKTLGFDIENFGKNSVVIHGIPADLHGINSAEMLEGILENFKLNNLEVKLDKRDNLCRAMAKNTCIKYGKALGEEEIKLLLSHLFATETPGYTVNGKNIIVELNINELEKLFKKR